MSDPNATNIDVFHPDFHMLGRKPTKHDPRTLMLADFVKPAALPIFPRSMDWGYGTKKWGMMKNDLFGCCTAAGAGHLEILWNDRAGHPVTITDNDVIQMYEDVTEAEGARFSPMSGINDNGCAELDVLNYYRRVGIGGHKIEAFASIRPSEHDLIKAAIWLFGAVYVGIDLPISAQGRHVWDFNGSLTGHNKPGSWGGHCVILTAYDDEGLTCITWGVEQKLTWRWWDAYGDEAYALLSKDWITVHAVSPSDYNMDDLMAKLQEVTK